MRIAFLGKGGSGKTVMSSLFSLYADSQKYRVGLVDVDVNSHTDDVLGLTSRELSLPENITTIQAYLQGDNPRIKSSEWLNTTPPSTGSNHWRLGADNSLTEQFGAAFGERSHLFRVGSYKAEEIGVGCHHTTQTIVENMLSHAQLDERDIIVIDSVAGNDIFANSLYLQDLLVLVVKPEREGVSVFQRFYSLAEHVGLADRVRVIGNQVMTKRQQAFLEDHIPADILLGCLPVDETVIDRRLDGKPLTIDLVTSKLAELYDAVIAEAKPLARSPAELYKELTTLHQKVAAESWVAGAYRAGLEDQIDPDYQP